MKNKMNFFFWFGGGGGGGGGDEENKTIFKLQKKAIRLTSNVERVELFETLNVLPVSCM